MTPETPESEFRSPLSFRSSWADLDPEEVRERMKGTISDWLAAEGVTFEEDEPEEGIAWRLIAQVSEDWTIQVVQDMGPVDKIAVGTGTSLNEYHRDRIREESPEARRRFNQVLRDSLHSELVEKTFEVETPDDQHPLAGVPEAFLLRRTIFADGLTKNRFFEAISRVHGVRMRAVTTIQAWYGTREQPLDPVIGA